MTKAEDTELDFSTLKVLLVEDNKHSIKLERMALYELGFRIENLTIKGDGSEALSAIQAMPNFDLIISDWNMPEVDGLELFQLARRRWPRIPFLMLTNNDSVEQVQLATVLGVNAYVVKPFSISTLGEQIILALQWDPGADQSARLLHADFATLRRVREFTRGLKHKSAEWAAETLSRMETLSESLVPGGRVDQESLREFMEGAQDVQRTSQSMGNDFVPVIVAQLNEFVAQLDDTTALQLQVIRLHLDAIRIATLGHAEEEGEFDPEGLIRGLRMAAAKALL